MDGLEPEYWYRCPRRPVKDDPQTFNRLFSAYSLREKGLLLYPGSYLEQPAALVQGMAVMDRALAEVEGLKDKKREAMSNR